MPPKRKATGSGGGGGPARKRTNAAAASAVAAPAAPAEPEYNPPRSKRWSKVSGSANAEASYRMVWKDKEKAYSYITICTPYHAVSNDEDDENSDSDSDGDSESGKKPDKKKGGEDEEEGGGEDDNDDDGAERLGPRCRKRPCYCNKLVGSDSNPEHPWVISWAGMKKFENQFLHMDLRVPDYFSMYTFNDHGAYGSLEVLQNLILDFEEAAKEWREQWAVCEGVVHWLAHPASRIFEMGDDPKAIRDTTALLGRMFLAILARLDSLDLVGDNTAVKSLGCTMAMYMTLAISLREDGLLSDDDREESMGRLEFQPNYFEKVILSYAQERGVTLRGPDDIDEVVAQVEDDVALPEKNAKDPWHWKAALRRYKGMNSLADKRGKIGGDRYDVTAMSAAERRAASFTGRDPFTKKDIDALKEGLILQPSL